MLNFLRDINIRELRENNLKLIFGLGALVYITFGILLHTGNVEYRDPVWLRMVILTVSLITLGFALYYKPARKHFINILFGILYLYNAHLYYLLFANNFDPNYKLALLIVTFASILFIQDKRLNLAYLIINLVTHAAILLATNSLSPENISVALLICTTLIIGYFTNSERIDAFRQIKDREAVLNAINNNVYHGIFRINGEDQIIYANENFAHMLGYRSVEEIYNVSRPFIFISQDAARHVNIMKREKKTIKNLEVEIQSNHKGPIWVLLSLTPFFNAKGNLTCYDGAIIDITDRKSAEKELTLFSAAIDHSTVCVAITDKQGCIRYVNPFFTQITGYTPDELFGTKIQQYLLPGDKGVEEMLISLKEDRFWKGEIKHYTKAGKLVTELVSIAPVRNKEGQITNYVIVAEDISKRKEAEEELLRAKEMAEMASKTQEQFLSMVSHELRTPMNAVIGLTNLLLEENPRPDQAENLKILRFSANNLLALINDILDLSKIEAGKLDIAPKEFELNQVLSLIRQTHGIRAKQKNLELILQVSDSIPAVLIGDDFRLSQILNNLVSNAVKFTDQGKVQISVSGKKITDTYAELEFSVSDTGIGIPADKLPHIFEAFSPASMHTNRIYGGTGLGLAITRKLIELQGGSITVHSEAGKGTTFTFTIPYKVSTKKSLPRHQEVHDYSAFNSIRVLLVEDNRINQKVAVKFLKKWDAQVEIAENGQEAISKLQSDAFDLVLMDLQMPVMDGYEATRLIRSNPDLKHIPIIALTASAMSHEREKAFEAGVNDFICKPFVPSEFYGKIAQYTSGTRSQRKTA
ncbi:MAG: hypothetical protein KatS3mg031_2139 [Chitinophagales bacterium]|nr:MAG: hypothetical protein KatS3mg031_2139 [Chitinophagales bacterium]